MEQPVFLLLIAEEIENQIIKTIPLTIMTEDEARSVIGTGPVDPLHH